MNTPELHENDNCDCNHIATWPSLYVREDDPADGESPCAVCGTAVRWRELAIGGRTGILCDGCAYALAPELFRVTREVIGMADRNATGTMLALRHLVYWLDRRASF